MIHPDFWRNKRVLLTGHTGFKGTWMALWLSRMGARVTGFALQPDSSPSLFELLGALPGVTSLIGDVCDARAVREAVDTADPEIVIHMAAQALVRRSYREPVETLAANVMGTANLMEALRKANSLRVALVVTSDKVYQNSDDGEAFAEDAPLGGDDPYSASKAAQEIVAHAWAKSFFADRSAVIATARAGNVIGGGDFSEDRLIPDIYRALAAGENLVLRSPDATRPWQHVLDLNMGYLMYVERLAEDAGTLPHTMNFGPAPGVSYTVGAITEKMMAALGGELPVDVQPSALKEKTLLSVDARRAFEVLGWRPRLDTDAVIRMTADWYGAFLNGADAGPLSAGQLDEYEALL